MPRLCSMPVGLLKSKGTLYINTESLTSVILYYHLTGQAREHIAVVISIITT